MNKFIEEELHKCKVADIQSISDTEYLVTKVKSPDKTLMVNGCYLIELADYIIHPNENFTLADNWNKGVIPKSKYLKASVTKIMGKMIKVDAISDQDNNEAYLELWLPMGGIKVLKEI